MIETAETTYGPAAARSGTILPPDRHAEYALVSRRENAARLLSTGQEPPEALVEPSSSDIAGHPIAVYVNHGRWMVDCPGVDCWGAQVASRDDHRFFCVTCGNNFIGGRWLAVVWPDDADGIAAALSVRPVTFRNWTPDVALEQLLRDNADPVNGL